MIGSGIDLKGKSIGPAAKDFLDRIIGTEKGHPKYRWYFFSVSPDEREMEEKFCSCLLAFTLTAKFMHPVAAAFISSLILESVSSR